MRKIVETPLHIIRQQKEELQEKDAQLQSLGFSLAQEKAKNVQKDVMLSQLGQEVAQLKIEIIQLKGAVSL